MEAFLSEWYGILTFVLFDVLALIVVISITYCWLFKRLLDVLISGVCLIVFSPVLLVLFLVGNSAVKDGRIEEAVSRETFVGKKEKRIALRSFALSKGKLFPRLFDVFCGRVSFIGPLPMRASDCAFLDEEEEERFLVRPGLINPLVRSGDEETDYDDMLEIDVKYVKKYSFFEDVKIFFAWLLKKIRGEGNGYLGKTRQTSYAKALLDEGRITEEDYRVACEEGE